MRLAPFLALLVIGCAPVSTTTAPFTASEHDASPQIAPSASAGQVIAWGNPVDASYIHVEDFGAECEIPGEGTYADTGILNPGTFEVSTYADWSGWVDWHEPPTVAVGDCADLVAAWSEDAGMPTYEAALVSGALYLLTKMEWTGAAPPETFAAEALIALLP